MQNFLYSLTLLLLPGLFSCSNTGKDPNGIRILKLAYVVSPGGPAHETAEYFANLVEQKTNGRLKIKIYSSGQLGRERELIEGLNMHSVDLVLAGPSAIGWYAPAYGAVEAPFIFRSYEHLDKVMNGPVGKEIEKKLLEVRNIRILDYWHRGPRYLTTTNKKIFTPDDLEGLKIRVPELPIYIKAWEILGANPTPIAYNEMFLALNQKVVEGQENPLEVIYTSSLYEVQKYVMNTEHLLSFYVLMINDKLLNSLEPDMRKAVQEAAGEAGTHGHELMLKYEIFYKEELRKKGMEFIDVDKEAFREKTIKKIPEAFRKKWAPNLFERMTAF